MPTTKKKAYYWPTAVVLSVVVASLTAAYIFVPDNRDEIVYGVGLAGSLVLALMRSLAKEPTE